MAAATTAIDAPTTAEAVAKCACFNLRKATRVVTQLYDDLLRPTGLRTTQFTLLAATWRLQPVAVNDLADRVVMDRTTLTRNLKPLERDGLVRIAPGRDRRVREVELTREGQEALGRALPLWRQAQAQVAEKLGENRLQHLLQELVATVEAIRE